VAGGRGSSLAISFIDGRGNANEIGQTFFRVKKLLTGQPGYFSLCGQFSLPHVIIQTYRLNALKADFVLAKAIRVNLKGIGYEI